MVINWPEIGIQTALIVGLLAVAGAYLRYRVVPKLKAHAGEWAGAAIGRFWQTLTEEAQGEEGSGGTPGTGVLKLGGFEIEVGTIRELLAVAPQILQVLKMFGLGGSGGGGENPFLK